ncbi:MAG: TIGR03435 family protein [Acidobacteriota bacterium]|nr:TIGR03435 family protein [Acidobacteriota bacterium]
MQSAGVRVAIFLLAFLLFPAPALYAQQPAEPPRYEVASVNPAADDDPRMVFHIGPDGSLSATGITLRRLMMTAYEVQGFRIAGGPAWVSSRRWDIQARPNRAAAPPQVHRMLRELLEDRFQLRVRPETRNMPVYDLIADRKGAKVPASRDTQGPYEIHIGPGTVELTNASSSTFASQLTYALAHQIVDKTGLSGSFDFKLEWTPEPGEDGGPTTSGLPPGMPDPAPPNKDRPSIFTAVREQLGLRLVPARGPVDVVVIDSVRMPTAN